MSAVLDPASTMDIAQEDNPNETSFLVKMVREYLNQLQSRIDFYERRNFRLWSIGVGLGTAYFVLALIVKAADQARVPVLQSIIVQELIVTALITIFAAGALLLTLMWRSRTSSKDSVRNAERSLAVLVKRASQYRDRGRVSFAESVLLELVLAEAELLLQRAQKITGFI